MSKIVSMSSGAIDPINRTKRVFWRPDTATTVLKVGQPVCYNSDCVCDHKERTADPTHLGLTEDTYAEGAQDFTGRLFIVEEPLTANLHAYAGICKSLGPKAGADGDMIEIFVPTEGAVVPVRCDQQCYADRTVMGIRNAEADVSYPGKPIGIAVEDIDLSTNNGLCWMRFKKFIQDNANELYRVEDECGAGVNLNLINFTSAQTAGTIKGLQVSSGRVSGGGSVNNIGLYTGSMGTATIDSLVALQVYMGDHGGDCTVGEKHAFDLNIDNSDDATLCSFMRMYNHSGAVGTIDAAFYFANGGAESVTHLLKFAAEGDCLQADTSNLPQAATHKIKCIVGTTAFYLIGVADF